MVFETVEQELAIVCMVFGAGGKRASSPGGGSVLGLLQRGCSDEGRSSERVAIMPLSKARSLEIRRVD